ncbi:MAG: hypothetical protein K2X97_20850 [Mycobacteriaceae bacterium]|nr:hypothetical protein [Mycobacteriaceae bacterium]
MADATDRNRFAASSWLGSLESRGGTVMAEPLYQAADLLAETGEDRQASVVLVTDGQITGEDHLLRTLAPALGRTRVYCVGIDRAVNAGFLDRLATLGHGRSELVESEERLDEVMARLARTIGRPALTSVRVRAQGVSLLDGTVTPERSPDAFAGIPCVLSGRYRGSGDATFHVEADGSFATALPARVVPEAVAVRTIWARSVVRDLEDEYASYAADDELAARLVAHSVRFGVLSRFTAFVAIDPEHTDAGPLTEVVQPVEQPSGWATNVGFVASAVAMPAPGGAMPMLACAPPAEKELAAPRPLDKLLKQVEKATQVRRSGLESVLDELKQHRDAATDPELRVALDQLCAALARFLQHPTGPQSRQVLVAVDAVKRAMTARPAKRRFWR